MTNAWCKDKNRKHDAQENVIQEKARSICKYLIKQLVRTLVELSTHFGLKERLVQGPDIEFSTDINYKTNKQKNHCQRSACLFLSTA